MTEAFDPDQLIAALPLTIQQMKPHLKIVPSERPAEDDLLPAVDRLIRFRSHAARTGAAVEGESGRDKTMKMVTSALVRYALAPEVAGVEIRKWNDSCDPPWSDAEISFFEGESEKYLADHPEIYGIEVRVDRMTPAIIASAKPGEIEKMKKIQADPFDHLRGTKFKENTRREKQGCLDNDMRALLSLVGPEACYNEFAWCVEWNGKKIDKDDEFALAMQFSQVFDYVRSEQQVARSLEWYASKIRRYNPVKDYLNSHTWDNVPRFAEAAAHMYAIDGELAEIYLRKWFIGAVARAMHPGAKMDNQLTIKSNQGFRKSSWGRAIAGDWFARLSVKDILNKDTFLSMQGKLIMEIAEMRGQTNPATIDEVKDFLDNPIDRFRRPYGRNIEDFPRQCVFLGTTNRSAFLFDDTGSRRFWPIECEEPIDDAWFMSHRDQLWAEAYTYWKAIPFIAEGIPDPASCGWWLTPEEEAARKDQARKYTRTDPLEEEILDAALARQEPFTTGDLLRDLQEQSSPAGQAISGIKGGLDLHKYGGVNAARVEGVLTRKGYVRKNRKLRGSVRKRWWNDVGAEAAQEVRAMLPLPESAHRLVSHLCDVYNDTGLLPTQNELAAYMNVSKQRVSQIIESATRRGLLPARDEDAPLNAPRNLTPTREAYKLVGKFPARLLGLKK